MLLSTERGGWAGSVPDNGDERGVGRGWRMSKATGV
jgi:hypothetical protein